MNTQIDWNEAMNLEELIRDAFDKKKERSLIEMIKILPPGLREKCRRIWMEETEKRKKR